MTVRAFVGLGFLLGCIILSIVDGEADLKPIHSKDAGYQYWLFQGKNISKICEASKLVNGSTYYISWFWNNKEEITNTSNQIITNVRTGNILTGTIVIKNVTRFENRVYVITCALVTNGLKGYPRYLDFVPLRNCDFSSLFQLTFLSAEHGNCEVGSCGKIVGKEQDKNLPNVVVTAEKNNVEYGEEVKLNCTVRGNLSTAMLDIEWRKDGKTLKKDKQSEYGEEVNLQLIIQRAEGSSGGMYVCLANKPSWEFLFEANDTATVVVFPKLIGPKKKVDHYFYIGDKVNVLCDIDGYPLSITWQRKSAEGNLQNVSDGGHFQFKDNGKRLTIDSFQSGDATDFICQSKDKNGADILQTTTLTQRVDPTIDAVEKSVTLIPGQQFSLQCDIHAVPLCVVWSIYEPKKLTKSHVTDSTRGVLTPARCSKTLRITNVTAFADGQIFSCSDGDVVQNISAVIPTKPHLYGPSSKEVKVEEGDDATLTCDITVNPLNITWLVDGCSLSASSNRYTMSSVDPRIVNIKDVEYDDRKSFYCSAKNVLDPKGVKQEIILRVKVQDPSAALWPAIGIAIAAVVVALMIGVSCYIKRRKEKQSRNDANPEQGIELDGEPSQPLVT